MLIQRGGRCGTIASLVVLMAGCSAAEDRGSDARNVSSPDSSLPDGGQRADGSALADADAPDTGAAIDLCEGLDADAAFDEYDGPIEGALIIFVSQNGLPIAGAKVMIAKSGASWSGVSGSSGCIAFQDPSLTGAVDVHAFASGLAFRSFLSRTRRLLYVDLFNGAGEAGPEPATIRGTITNLLTVSATTATQGAYASVSQIKPNVFWTRPAQALRAGEATLTENAVLLGLERNISDYSLVADPSTDLGLYALGAPAVRNLSSYTVQQATQLAVLRGVATSTGQTLEDIDLEFTLPLDQMLTYEVRNAPAADIVMVQPMVFLDDGGSIAFDRYFNYPWPAQFPQPALSGVLAGASYGAIGLAYDSDGTRRSYRFERSSRGATITLDDWLQPPDALMIEGRKFIFSAADAVDYCAYYVYVDEETFWRIDDFSPAPLFELPEVPEGFVDPLAGSKKFFAYCYRAPGWSQATARDVVFADVAEAEFQRGFEVTF